MTGAWQAATVFLLAGISFRNPWRGFLMLLIGILLGDRAFCQIHLGTFGLRWLPALYVTEAALFGWGGRVLWDVMTGNWKPGAPSSSLRCHFPWLLLGLGGYQSMIRGILGRFRLADVFRDSAMIYYSLFTAWTRHVLLDWRRCKQLGKIAAIALLAKTLYGFLLGQIAETGGFQPSATSMYFAVCLILSGATFPLWRRKHWWYGILILQGTLIVLLRIRTSWAAITLALGAWCCLLLWFRIGPRAALPRVILVLLAAILLAFGLSKARIVRVNSNGLVNEFSSFFQGKKMANLMTRLWFWRDAVEEVTQTGLAREKVIAYNPIQEKPLEPEHLAAVIRSDAADRSMIARSAGIDPRRLKRVSPEDIRRIEGGLQRERSLTRRISQIAFGLPFGRPFVPPRVWWLIQDTKRYDPHNSYVAIFYRTGALGLLSILWVILGEFRITLRTLNSTGTSLLKKQLLVGLLACLIYHIAHAMTDVTLENPHKGVLFWILLGVLAMVRQMEIPEPSEESLSSEMPRSYPSPWQDSLRPLESGQ